MTVAAEQAPRYEGIGERVRDWFKRNFGRLPPRDDHRQNVVDLLFMGMDFQSEHELSEEEKRKIDREIGVQRASMRRRS